MAPCKPRVKGTTSSGVSTRLFVRDNGGTGCKVCIQEDRGVKFVHVQDPDREGAFLEDH